jgi:hypothetical protein
MADVLDLNQSHKPKWELMVLTPNHKWKLINDDTFHVLLLDDTQFNSTREITKQRMESRSGRNATI